MFKLKLSTLILRWYFMMLVGIAAVYTAQWWMILLSVLVAVSAILGYRFEGPAVKEEGKVVPLEGEAPAVRRKAG